MRIYSMIESRSSRGGCGNRNWGISALPVSARKDPTFGWTDGRTDGHAWDGCGRRYSRRRERERERESGGDD